MSTEVLQRRFNEIGAHVQVADGPPSTGPLCGQAASPPGFDASSRIRRRKQRLGLAP